MLVNDKLDEITDEEIRKEIQSIAPNSDEVYSYDKEMFSLISQFMRNPDRDFVAKLLKHNNPSENHLMLWLESNVPINKLIFIDSHVKYKWNKDYFYELLSYSVKGNKFAMINYPRRITNA